MVTRLDLGRAWNDASALIAKNARVIFIVAGVFFFLPGAISALFMPGSAELEAALASPDIAEDPQELLQALIAYYGQIWWIILIVSLVQAVGVLGLLRLLTDRGGPTVGEALAFGVKALVPYLAAQLLAGIIIVATIFLLGTLGGLLGAAGAVLALLIAVVLAIYMWVKFSLTSPVIAIEKVFNPLHALRRSWQLTKGNSLRLFLFYLLLIIVAIVVMLLASMVFAIFTLAGEDVGLFASGIGGSLVSMGLVVVMLAVLAAVHQQLAGTGVETETFD